MKDACWFEILRCQKHLGLFSMSEKIAFFKLFFLLSAWMAQDCRSGMRILILLNNRWARLSAVQGKILVCAKCVNVSDISGRKYSIKNSYSAFPILSQQFFSAVRWRDYASKQFPMYFLPYFYLNFLSHAAFESFDIPFMCCHRLYIFLSFPEPVVDLISWHFHLWLCFFSFRKPLKIKLI